MKKKAFITGATSGIGKATAFLLAENGWDLVLNARRNELLLEIQSEIKSKYKSNIDIVAFDVSDRQAVEAAFKNSENYFLGLTVLINNAGLARGVDPMDKANLDDWESMIDTNIMGLLYVTRLSLPFLKEAQGHIVNVGSVAGRSVYPGGSVYCATKFAVGALTEGLRMDLHGSGVRVTNIAPGLVETNFSQVRLQDDKKAKAVYQGLEVLRPEDIAESIFWSLSRPKHVNIQEMVIYPTDQASVSLVQRK